ncbi:MAG: MFS transporter [Aeriscardovia sp.]|nr:MFS transporter [Aeriscardovia sp.]MBO7717792.1 MFS transporter [Aeriscardovia sp.]
MRVSKDRWMVYLGIIACTILAVTSTFANKCVNVMYPQIASDFRVSVNATEWMTTGYMLAQAVMAASTAYILKRVHAKKVEITGCVLYLGATLLCALSPSFAPLVIGRIVQGMAVGLEYPTTLFLILTQISPRKRATASGILGGLIGVAVALGPMWAGWLENFTSWRWIFWSLVPFIVISLILTIPFVRNKPQGTDAKFSFLSLALMAAGLAVLDFAISSAGSHGFDWRFWLLLAGGVAIMAIFVLANRSTRRRLFELDLFLIPAIACGAAIYFLSEAVNIGMQALIPTYAQYALDSSPFISGLILAPGSLLGSVGAIVSGKWADKKGYGAPLLAGSVMMCVGTALVYFLQPFLNAGITCFFYIFQRVGFAFLFTNTITGACSMLPESKTPDINAMFSVINNYSASVGSAVMLSSFSLTVGEKSGFGAAFAGGKVSFGLGFWLTLAMVAIAVAFYFLTRKKEGRKKPAGGN